VRAAAGGNAGRVSMWVADDDPYLGTPVPSPLVKADRFSVWEPIPFGQDARGNRITVPVMWQSLFFGGLPRRGKTFTQRLMTAAANAGPASTWAAAAGPRLGTPVSSPLVRADRCSVWEPIPFGQDARGNRITVPVMWQSLFFGGLPRRGKTFTQRLMTAAGLLD